MAALCADCGCDLSARHHLAKLCFPCAKTRQSAPDVRRAHSAVAKAVRCGELDHPKTLECVDCGAQARDYDHRDYSRPLDVVPVCRSCNKLRGPGLRALVQEQVA